MSPAFLYMLQRLSAMIMAPLVVLHVVVMIYAVQGGLNAGEILSRTQGSIFWGAVYGLFVLAVAVHASIGLQNILREIIGIKGVWLTGVTVLIFLILATLGGRAVVAVVL